jgi:hypothetical protein
MFQCTSASGETLFTDSGCPRGYRTDLVIPDPPAPAKPTAEETAASLALAEVSRQAAEAEQRKQLAEAEAARVAAELENARLRSELQQEQLRAIDSKLDALLDAQAAALPVYGAAVAAPVGVVSKPLADCGGKPGHCRPAHRRNDLNAKRFSDQRPSCGITGCTPRIGRSRGAASCGIAGCTPTITRLPELGGAGRMR